MDRNELWVIKDQVLSELEQCKICLRTINRHIDHVTEKDIEDIGSYRNIFNELVGLIEAIRQGFDSGFISRDYTDEKIGSIERSLDFIIKRNE